MSRKTTDDPDNPLITDTKGFKRVADADPDFLAAIKRARGRPPVERPRRQITLRLDASLIDAIRAEGKNYTARVEKALRHEFLDQ